ncbi:MAG: hypothetical protein HYV94_03560 [Candidatus Rokubacteria bacterium]|nr:hypothetical protein [Candidatus Rokubacteria bacterium]
MSRLYLTAARDEIARRRALVPKGRVVEAWPDLADGATFWLGEETKALLESVGPPVAVELSLPADAIPVYYGPKLSDLESLPREESLKTRVLSAHGIAVAWITLDRFGQRAEYEPKSPADPVFHLRRVGGGAGHLWRLFHTREEAATYMRESYGADSEGAEWAQGLAVRDFAELLERHGRREGA